MRDIPFDAVDALACSLVDRNRSGDYRRRCDEYVAQLYRRYLSGLEPIGGSGIEVLHRCECFICWI